MRFFSTVLAVAALALVGASGEGAMAPRKSPVPAVIPKTSLFRGWVTVTINGQTFPGYADWRGFPDSVPTNDPTTWVFVGSGSSWRLLSAAEAAAWHAEVRPGDVLYTPPYHWHHVETGHESSALSVLVPWDPTAEEPAPACMLGIVKPE
jgi:hypothetical protein